MIYANVFIDPEPEQDAIEAIRRTLGSDATVRDHGRLRFVPFAVTLGPNEFGEYDEPDSDEVPVSGYASFVSVPRRDQATRRKIALEIFNALRELGRYRLLAVDDWTTKLAEFEPS